MKMLLLLMLLLAVSASAQTTLADHMVAQLVSRTNGTSCAGMGPVNGANGIVLPASLNTNYWLNGVTNITAEAAGCYHISFGGWYAGGLTAISPRHCAYATHKTPDTTNVWLLPNGTLYTNWVVAWSNNVADPNSSYDIGICLMANTNPVWAKIFPNATNYIGAWYAGGSGTLPPFVRNHRGSGPMWFYGYTNGPSQWYEPNFVTGASSIGLYGSATPILFGDYMESATQTNGPQSWPNGTIWISGDSGGACYGVIKNEAVLVGCVYSGGYTPSLAVWKTQVDAAMATLSTANSAPVYSTTLYDVSSFPVYYPPPPIIYGPATFR